MKIIITIILFFASFNLFASDKTHKTSHYNERLCKVFTLKAKIYKKNMRQDAYAQITLQSYKDRAKLYCTK
ncbi:hypothetical protein [Sulfurimonas sp.]|uniref:hypothetical protein n=1 Tax=Sulfurimonas sp. TaxID=2022749 RepID=UPI00260523E8|nr:hypothetical protein [Sulfurimonas sp.]